MRIRASDVARATAGRLVGPDVDIDGASFDSRSIRRGELFVPLVAARDGHDFIDAALAAGAAGYLTSRPATGGSAIEVDDTAASLMALAGWARERITADVVGITGSVGKTSTKDLVAAALRRTRRVTANERSFNNEQGLPVTVLGAADDTDVLVLEMGMRGHGEIARLCAVGQPTIGVVTTVADSHTERVGGIDGVARAKRELVECLPAGGTAVLNADDPRVAAMAAHTDATVITFGAAGSADVRITDLTLDSQACAWFHVRTPWGAERVRLTVCGAHMAANAAAAIGVAGVLGVDIAAASGALSDAAVSPMRMHATRTTSGAVVLDDTYNANPTSMRAALDALAGVSARRRIAVLGPMAELDSPEAGHRDVQAYAASLGIELIAVGTDLYGVRPVDDPVAALGELAGGDAVLFKASRIAGLEREVARLLAAAHT